MLRYKFERVVAGPDRADQPASTGRSWMVPIVYEWRAAFANTEVEALHGEGFEHDPLPAFDSQAQLDRYSLGWVCVRDDRELVGFVNVAWDGPAMLSFSTRSLPALTNVGTGPS